MSYVDVYDSRWVGALELLFLRGAVLGKDVHTCWAIRHEVQMCPLLCCQLCLVPNDGSHKDGRADGSHKGGRANNMDRIHQKPLSHTHPAGRRVSSAAKIS